MINVVIIVLTFVTVAVLALSLLPAFIDKYESDQRKKFAKTVKQLDNMFVEVKKEKLLFLGFALSPLLLGIAAFVFFGNILAVAIGVVVGAGLPPLIIKNLEKMRKQKFNSQLVDYLLVLSNCLKSGLTLLQAIEVVVEEMPPPISQEFKLVLNESKMGLPLEESLSRLTKRIYSEELNMMTTAILVGRETGGDLSKIFERLVFTIRQKLRISRQVETLTMQARWQGMIMMGLPIIFVIGITQVNPHFFDIMLKSETGRVLLIYAVVSQVIGMVMIKALSKVEV